MLRFTLSSRSEARDLLPTPFQLLLSLLLSLSLPFASVYVCHPACPDEGRDRGAAAVAAPTICPDAGRRDLSSIYTLRIGSGALGATTPPPLKILHHQKLFVQSLIRNICAQRHRLGLELRRIHPRLHPAAQSRIPS